MPWKESNALEQRNAFITEWLKGEHSVTELCRIFEISRKTAYKWLERFELAGRSGLADGSRAPHHSPQAISEEKAAVIVGERQAHPTWGARKIVQSLMRKQAEEEWPAASSIGELLKREGLIQAWMPGAEWSARADAPDTEAGNGQPAESEPPATAGSLRRFPA
jgi:transposase